MPVDIQSTLGFLFWIFAGFSVANSAPPPLDGIDLPAVLDNQGIGDVADAVGRRGCARDLCRAWVIIARAFQDMEVAQSSPGTNVWSGRSGDYWPSRYRFGSDALTRMLRTERALFGAICADLTAVSMRDGMDDAGNDLLASKIFEVARRVSSAKLDCLGRVLPVIPDGPYRRHALRLAYDFCVADRSQDCRRLKAAMRVGKNPIAPTKNE